MQHLLQQPIYYRCDEISRWADECSIKDLEYVLNDIVEDIFGVTNKKGWNLLNIEYMNNPQEYDIIYKFLQPNGPMFRIFYKLLSDPYVKHKFHLSFLPQKIKQSIEDGTASPFYMEKLEVDPRTRLPLQLSLNPFELYMFHFVYHVVNPWFKTAPHQEAVYSSLYLRLAEEYLSVFLPCDGSTVLPELSSHYISQSPYRPIPQKPIKTSTLFRQEVLREILKQSPAVSTLQTSPHVGIWRSELVVQLCLDFWLSMPNSEGPCQMLWSQDQLPSCEHLHAVRLLIKHLHYFANSLVEDSSAMDQLKKMVILSSQRKVYHFIRQTMQHWPLDSSFKQILEIWLSYIQPWRYIDFRRRYDRTRADPHSPVDSRWIPFIEENLLMYSVIFHQLVERFKKIDLVSHKNAYMLFRLTKVFAQPNLCALMRHVEGSGGELDGRSCNKWVHLVDLEGPSYQYKPILQLDSNIQTLIRMVKTAETVAVRRVEEELQKEEQVTIWQKLFFSWSIAKSNLPEYKNVPIFLSAAAKNLMTMFEIPEDSMDFLSQTTTPSTPIFSRSPCANELSSARTRQRLNEVKYQGDPDLEPIRSYENTFLVRSLYYICCWLNYHYSEQIINMYLRRDILGGIARQVLCGPRVIYYFDKRVRLSPVRVSESLPPRLSLRPVANYYFLFYVCSMMLFVMYFFSLSLPAVFTLFIFLWVVFIVVRWALGLAPLAPTVSVHNASDLGPDLSLNS